MMEAERFVARPERALVLAAVLLAVVFVLAVLLPDRPVAVERDWAEWVRDVEDRGLTRAALVLNALGKGLWRYLVVAAVALVLLLARRAVALAAWAAAEILTPLLVTAVKALDARPRPAHGLVAAHGLSFPSGHAAYAGATAVGLVLLFTRPGRRRAPAWAIAALAVAAMAWSRTYLQVHWLGDVVAGSLLGVAVAISCFAAAQLLVRERPRVDPRDGR